MWLVIDDFTYTVILENPCFWNKNLNDVRHPEFGCWNMVRNNQTDASFNIYIQQILQQNHDYLKKIADYKMHKSAAGQSVNTHVTRTGQRTKDTGQEGMQL